MVQEVACKHIAASTDTETKTQDNSGQLLQLLNSQWHELRTPEPQPSACMYIAATPHLPR